MPKRTIALGSEKVASGRKICKTRLTFMPCANRAGTHKLKMMLIGTATKPRCFPQNIASLNIHYRSNKNAWMTRVLFAEWFNKEFVPSVRTFSQQKDIEPKALLLLDNCTGHHVGCDLESEDGLIKCAYLPANVTSLGQPMDQGVIAAIKMRYKKKLLAHLLLVEDEKMPFEKRLKQVSLLNCVDWLKEAWQEISADTVSNSWNKIFGHSETDEDFDDELEELRDEMEEMIGDDVDLESWINDTVVDEDFELYTDDELLGLGKFRF